MDSYLKKFMNKKRKSKSERNPDKALDKKRAISIQVLKLIEETTADSFRDAIQKIERLREIYPAGEYVIKRKVLNKEFLKLDETLTGIDKEIKRYNEEAGFIKQKTKTPKDLNTHNYI